MTEDLKAARSNFANSLRRYHTNTGKDLRSFSLEAELSVSAVSEFMSAKRLPTLAAFLRLVDTHRGEEAVSLMEAFVQAVKLSRRKESQVVIQFDCRMPEGI